VWLLEQPRRTGTGAPRHPGCRRLTLTLALTVRLANRDIDGCGSVLHSRSETLRRRVRTVAHPTQPTGSPCREGVHSHPTTRHGQLPSLGLSYTCWGHIGSSCRVQLELQAPPARARGLKIFQHQGWYPVHTHTHTHTHKSNGLSVAPTGNTHKSNGLSDAPGYGTALRDSHDYCVTGVAGTASGSLY
jgi:hypothetical protein